MGDEMEGSDSTLTLQELSVDTKAAKVLISSSGNKQEETEGSASNLDQKESSADSITEKELASKPGNQKEENEQSDSNLELRETSAESTAAKELVFSPKNQQEKNAESKFGKELESSFDNQQEKIEGTHSNSSAAKELESCYGKEVLNSNSTNNSSEFTTDKYCDRKQEKMGESDSNSALPDIDNTIVESEETCTGELEVKGDLELEEFKETVTESSDVKGDSELNIQKTSAEFSKKNEKGSKEFLPEIVESVVAITSLKVFTSSENQKEEKRDSEATGPEPTIEKKVASFTTNQEERSDSDIKQEDSESDSNKQQAMVEFPSDFNLKKAQDTDLALAEKRVDPHIEDKIESCSEKTSENIAISDTVLVNREIESSIEEKWNNEKPKDDDDKNKELGPDTKNQSSNKDGEAKKTSEEN